MASEPMYDGRSGRDADRWPAAPVEPGGGPDADALVPIPRAVLPRRTRALLWALRIVVLVLAVMVVSAFIVQVGR